MVFGQHYKEPNAVLGGLFAAFGRTLWALAVSFVIVACSSGNGGKQLKNLWFLKHSK